MLQISHKGFRICLAGFVIALILCGCTSNTSSVETAARAAVETTQATTAPTQAATETTAATTAPTQAATETTAATTAPTQAAVETTSATKAPAQAPFRLFDVSMQDTPNSSCFSQIGYDSEHEVLVVEFRDSGAIYTYSDFPASAWRDFTSASALGTWFNKNIKGYYDYEKIS